MNIKKLTALTLLFLQLSSPAIAFADPPKITISEESDIGAIISPLKKGQISPYTGTLFSPRAAASVITQIDSQSRQIIIEIEHTRKEEKAKCAFQLSEVTTLNDADKKISFAKLEEQNKRIIILTEQLKKEEKNHSNSSLWLGIGIGGGFVAGVGVTVLTVYAVNLASK
jgi:hypothetical protein